MTDQKFLEWRDPTEDWPADLGALTINGNPEYDADNTIMIGMYKHGEYQNIVLDVATALRFADAIQIAAGRWLVAAT